MAGLEDSGRLGHNTCQHRAQAKGAPRRHRQGPQNQGQRQHRHLDAQRGSRSRERKGQGGRKVPRRHDNGPERRGRRGLGAQGAAGRGAHHVRDRAHIPGVQRRRGAQKPDRPDRGRLYRRVRGQRARRRRLRDHTLGDNARDSRAHNVRKEEGRRGQQGRHDNCRLDAKARKRKPVPLAL